MTLAQVRDRLDCLLSDPRSKVVFLLGDWGTGKTHQWLSALRRSSHAASSAYVSAFGLTSAAELRRRIAEECVLTLKLPEGGTVGDAVAAPGGKLRLTQLLKLIPVLPYVGRLDGLAGELAYSAVRHKVICIDDLERASGTLTVNEILGVANHLKEERDCRVLLISNRAKLPRPAAEDLARYFEKVVDEWIEVAPTVQDALAIALPDEPTSVSKLLCRRVESLKITNIRVIKQLARLADEVQQVLHPLHPKVLEDAASALVLFGASHLCARTDLPPLEYLKKLESTWTHYFKNTARNAERTDSELAEERWNTTLQAYGYGYTSPLDLEIAHTVERGFVDRATLFAVGSHFGAELAANELRSNHEQILRLFYDAINEDGQVLLRDLELATDQAIGALSLGAMVATCNVFEECGRPNVAARLGEAFIAANQGLPGVFTTSLGSRERPLGAFGDALKREAERRITTPSIHDALDRIRVNQGWNPEDVQLVSTASTEQVEELLRGAQGTQFRRKVLALLQLGSMAGGDEQAKRVSETTRNILQRWSDADPVMAVRLRHHLAHASPQET